MDEMTGRNSKELQDMLFALSNGKPKGRLRGDGSFIADDLNWDTITFITGIMGLFSGGLIAFCCGVLGLIVPGAILYYLLQPDVRRVFGR